MLQVGTLVLVGAFLAACVALHSKTKRSREPYGLFHLELNAESSSLPQTEWLNMGFWKDTDSFPKACEALALRVAAAGHCVQGGRVLDVGHACGDSLLLQLKHPDLPRPASLTGITSLKLQHDRALMRVQNLSLSSPSLELFLGDAVFKPGGPSAQQHPLNPRSPSPSFTTILALDCAYHFVTREMFLRQCFHRLEPGGYIALGDLAMDPAPSAFLLRAFSLLLSIPSTNMVSSETYRATLVDIGFDDVFVDDISNNVFPAFRRFLRSRGGVWWVFQWIIFVWTSFGGRFVIVSARKPVTHAKEIPADARESIL